MKLFRRRKETRNYTDSQLNWTYNVASTVRLQHTQVLESCALLWSAALSASLPNTHEDVLTPEVLSQIGWDLIFRGESLFWWDSERLHPVSDFDVSGNYDDSTWKYDLTLSGPSTTHKVSAKADRVFHIYWRRDPQSRSAVAPSAELSRRMDELLTRELNASHGYIIPSPSAPTDRHSALRDNINELKGRHMMVESFMAGHDEGTVASTEWQQIRIGTDLPESLVKLRSMLVEEAGLITGVSPDLLSKSPGTSRREGMRMFAGTVVSSMLRQIAAEASRVLGGSSVEFSLGPLWASDFVGRTNTAVSLMNIYDQTGDEFWVQKAKEAVSV